MTKRKADAPDRFAAAMYRAAALRFYSRYAAARGHAKWHGEDLKGHHLETPEPYDIGEEYRKVFSDWLGEDAQTAAGVLAATELLGVIAMDQLLYDVTNEGSIVSDAEGAYEQAKLVRAMCNWLIERTYDEGGIKRGAAAE